MSDGPQPWPVASSKVLGDYRVFRVRQDFKISPRIHKPHDFYIIEACSWVTVVALTTSGQLVMVRQYRHGSDTVELEVPGGMIDEEETDPVVAGVRELLEETGYPTLAIHSLGAPAAACTGRLSNRVHSFFVEAGERVANLTPEPGVTVALKTPAELAMLIKSGGFVQQLHLGALLLAELRGFLTLPK